MVITNRKNFSVASERDDVDSTAIGADQGPTVFVG